MLGYASTLDEYPRTIHPWSNEAEMIIVNLDAVDVGSPSYNALLSRELARLIQWNQDRNETRWVKEGLTELGAALTGYRADGLYEAFLQDLDVSLTAWTGTEAQRGAVGLFMWYFHQRFGDEGTRLLTANSANGIDGFDAVLRELGTGLTFNDLFAEWLAAINLKGDSQANGSPHPFSGLDLPSATASTVYDAFPAEIESSVHPFGADIIVLRGQENLRIHFEGHGHAALLTEMPPVDAPVWWSNRADESLTSLSRSFNLRGVEEATLTYRAWFDIEVHYDYATAAASTDNGKTWQLLQPPSGTDVNPFGNNPGWGYTGRSDGWLREAIDLSNYAGGDVLVRFAYVTDGAVTGEGLLLDDISIVEIDKPGSARTGAHSWRVDGFIRTDGFLAQQYLAYLITEGDDSTFQALPLGPDQQGEWTVPLGGRDLSEAILLLSATSSHVREPAPYRLEITTSQPMPTQESGADEE